MGNKERPEWLKKRINLDENYQKTAQVLKDLELNTVCQAAFCPNLGECFRAGVATFMILGNVCSRNCKFCDIANGTPESINENEPANIKEAVARMGLEHVVITSVTRDDLQDGGSKHFVSVIKSLKEINNLNIEVLTPDFKGDYTDIKRVVKAKPDVYNHNIETIPRLYSNIRSEAKYQRSLQLLKTVKEIDNNIITKSGLMLGLGEKEAEVISVLQDLKDVNCDILTIGQYLQPSDQHAELKEYIIPDKFAEYRKIALKLGFKAVAAKPFVRSSYQAKKLYQKAKENS
ncbi:MAG: lipoyl synthase [Candidatus Cloacimonetes bacterium]|nr:lipoyl synthase [Candidatus Cloacimonadota bacterium]